MTGPPPGERREKKGIFVARNAGKAAGPWGTILPEVIAAVLNRVVKEAENLLGMPAEAVLREGLKKLLASKIEENDSIIEGLKEKYGASGHLELEDKIRRGEVLEHPPWEDVILWEELSRHSEALRGLIRRLEEGGAVAS